MDIDSISSASQPEYRDSEAERTRQQTFAIIGAAMEVHSRLGHGYLENVYQDALEIEFQHRGIPYLREGDLAVFYRGEALRSYYKFDFLCYSTIIVELKALSRVGDLERAQVMNYLKGTGLARGLLINFGAERLEYKRVIWSPHLSKSASSADRTGE